MPAQILRNQILEQQVIGCSIGCRQANKPGQRARNRHHAEHLRARAAALGAQQESQAKRLVEDAREGVRGVDGDGCQKRIDLALEIALGEGALIIRQLAPRHQAYVLLAHLGEQLVIPALILGGNEAVDLGRQDGQGLVGAVAVVALLAVAVFNALHEAGLANFNVLVEVRGGDGEKLDPLEERIGGVLSFLEHAPVELHPGEVAAVKELLFG